MKKINLFILSLFALVSANLPAQADNLPTPTQLNLKEPASAQMERISSFHDLLLWIIIPIVIFVTGLLVWVVIRYNAQANPEPSKTTHHVMLEILWTAIPVIILIIIAIPSFKMLYYLDRVEEPEMTLKVTGYQWYWGVEYQDYDDLAFDVRLISDHEIDESKGEKRLLSTYNKVVLPIDTNIQILVTSNDVIHAFTIPEFGFKKDAVPGRLNETWVRIDKPGTYYGQCSQICGVNHAYMPVEIEAVTKEEFEQWLIKAKEEHAFNAPQNDNNNNRAFNVALLEGTL